jgi:hypothetical protein
MEELNLNNFIIFLDIDGVLCSYDDFGEKDEADKKTVFRSYSINALNQIIDYYKADLCMISSWNMDFCDVLSYKDFLKARGVHVNNLTIGNHKEKSEYLKSLIKEGLNCYLIIDDETFEYHEFIPFKRILQTNKYRCLDEYDFKNVCFNLKLNI